MKIFKKMLEKLEYILFIFSFNKYGKPDNVNLEYSLKLTNALILIPIILLFFIFIVLRDLLPNNNIITFLLYVIVSITYSTLVLSAIFYFYYNDDSKMDAIILKFNKNNINGVKKSKQLIKIIILHVFLLIIIGYVGIKINPRNKPKNDIKIENKNTHP